MDTMQFIDGIKGKIREAKERRDTLRKEKVEAYNKSVVRIRDMIKNIDSELTIQDVEYSKVSGMGCFGGHQQQLNDKTSFELIKELFGELADIEKDCTELVSQINKYKAYAV